MLLYNNRHAMCFNYKYGTLLNEIGDIFVLFLFVLIMIYIPLRRIRYVCCLLFRCINCSDNKSTSRYFVPVAVSWPWTAWGETLGGGTK